MDDRATERQLLWEIRDLLKAIAAERHTLVEIRDTLKTIAANTAVRPRQVRPSRFGNPSPSEVVAKARSLVLAAKRPMQMSEIVDELDKHGTKISSKDPDKVVASMIARQPGSLVHLGRKYGWWATGVEVPHSVATRALVDHGND